MKALFFLFLMATTVVYADTVFLNPETCVNDSFSNVTYCGQWMQLNIGIQLNYSTDCLKLQEPARGYCLQANPPFTEWVNDTLGIAVTAPPFPTIDENATIWANSTLNNFSSWNLGVTCLKNVSEINTTIYQNQTVTIFINQTQTPVFNQELFYGYNQTYSNQTLNFTIHCPPLPNLNLKRQFDWGEIYRDDSFGINISCGTPGINQELFYGDQIPQGMYCVNYSRTLNCTKQYTIQTANGTQTICFDKLEDLCTPGEIMGFDIRGCYERNILGLKSLSESINKQLSICSFEKNACVNGTLMSQNERLTTQGTLESVFLILLVGAGVALGVYLYFKRKKHGELPKEPPAMDVT